MSTGNEQIDMHVVENSTSEILSYKILARTKAVGMNILMLITLAW